MTAQRRTPRPRAKERHIDRRIVAEKKQRRWPVVPEKFVGSWRLVGLEWLYPDGSVRTPPWEVPLGFAVFSVEGYVSAHVFRRDRPALTSDDVPTLAPEELAEAFRGCAAYYGKCDIDEETATWVTHVEGSLMPNWIGGDQVRTFAFRDGKLAATSPPVRNMIDGQVVTPTWIWERAV